MLILKYKQIKRTEVWLKIWVFTRFQFILLVFNLTLNFLSSQCSLDSLSKIAYVALIGLMPCNMLTSNFLFFWKSAQIQKKKDGKWVVAWPFHPNLGVARAATSNLGVAVRVIIFAGTANLSLVGKWSYKALPLLALPPFSNCFFFFFLFLEFWYF